MRIERVREQGDAAAERRERRLRQVEVLEQQAAADAQMAGEEDAADRIAAMGRSWRRWTRAPRSGWGASWPGSRTSWRRRVRTSPSSRRALRRERQH